jgi:hypothetical protein
MVSHRNRTLAQKTARAKEKRERRFNMKKEERKDPSLKIARLSKNKTITLDQKRVWDDVDNDELTSSVDLQALRRRRIQQAEEAEQQAAETAQAKDVNGTDGDADSMLDSDEDENDSASDEDSNTQARPRQNSAAPSIASTSNIDLTPESLIAKFPSLFSENSRPKEPKGWLKLGTRFCLRKGAIVAKSSCSLNNYRLGLNIASCGTRLRGYHTQFKICSPIRTQICKNSRAEPVKSTLAKAIGRDTNTVFVR